MGGRPPAATYTASEVAALFGLSESSVRRSVRRRDFPIAQIRVGRRLLWARAQVDSFLGIRDATDPHPVSRALRGEDASCLCQPRLGASCWHCVGGGGHGRGPQTA